MSGNFTKSKLQLEFIVFGISAAKLYNLISKDDTEVTEQNNSKSQQLSARVAARLDCYKHCNVSSHRLVASQALVGRWPVANFRIVRQTSTLSRRYSQMRSI